MVEKICRWLMKKAGIEDRIKTLEFNLSFALDELSDLKIADAERDTEPAKLASAADILSEYFYGEARR